MLATFAAASAMILAPLYAGDNHDGTFTNPMIWADFPDPDIIRVDDHYYFVSTSMFFFPGVTVMESMDLVNWRIASNAVPELKASPAYDLIGGNRYGKGQWATSIRHHNGLFYLMFNTNDSGSFICSAKDPHGPWEITSLGFGFHDPGLFFDDDGRVYVINGYSQLNVVELTPDFKGIKTQNKLIHKGVRSGLEGSHCYKRNGYYYIFCTYGGGTGYEYCLRAKNIYGPYEERCILKDDAGFGGQALHQAGIVQTPKGDFWGIIFQDRVGLGRVPYLVPMVWVNDWPIMGDPGNGNITMKKPDIDAPAEAMKYSIPSDDDFDSPELGLQWQFNHNPDRGKYSLTERKGFLRLHTATVTDSIMKARNTVCERIFGPFAEGTAKLDVSQMKTGDKAGLCIIQNSKASLCISRTDNGFQLYMDENEKPASSVVEFTAEQAKNIWLRAHIDGIKDLASFSYSFDGQEFHPLGIKHKMVFQLEFFCGNHYAIYNYAQKELGGYIDVDSFKTEVFPLISEQDWSGNWIEAEFFDAIYNAKVRMVNQDRREQDIVFENGGLIAFRCPLKDGDTKKDLELMTQCEVPGVKLTVKDVEHEKILGEIELPASGKEYKSVSMHLDQPVVSTKRLEFGIIIPRNSNRNAPTPIVSIDKFRFVK